MATMTAGQLVDVLRAFEPDTEVIVQTDTTTWRAIDRFHGPGGGARLYAAIVLVGGEVIAEESS